MKRLLRKSSSWWWKASGLQGVGTCTELNGCRVCTGPGLEMEVRFR